MDTRHRPEATRSRTRTASAGLPRPRRLLAGLAVLLLSVLAPAAVAPAAVPVLLSEEETHTLTVKVLDHNGQTPCPGCVAGRFKVFNDTYNHQGQLEYQVLPSDLATSGGGSVEVVPGVYTIMGKINDTADWRNYKSVTFLVEVEVPVQGDTTVVLDAREAVLMTPPTVPETGAQVRGHTFRLAKESALKTSDGSDTWFDYQEDLDFTNDTFYPNNLDLYVTPFPEPTLTRIVMTDKWVMAEPQEMRPDPYDSGSTQMYSETPAYVYHVPRAYTAGFDPSTLDHAYTAGEFTTVPTHYHSDYEDSLIATIHLARTTHHASALGETVMFRPGKVMQHYLASDEILWGNADWIYRSEDMKPLKGITADAFPAAGAGTIQPEQDRHSGPVRFALSETQGPYTDLWNSAPRTTPDLTPYVPAASFRGGELNERFLPNGCYNDNAGGIRFYSACPNEDSGTWSLKNLDTGLPLPLDPTGRYAPVFTGLPAEKTTYRLEQHLEDIPDLIKGSYRTQPAQHTEWTFTSAASDKQLSKNFTQCAYMPNSGTDRTCQIQPLLQLRYLLDLNTWNRAPAGERHVIRIEAGYLPEAVHAPGAGDSLLGAGDVTMSVEATFDDGATWHPVDVRQQGKSRAEQPERLFRAMIDHPALGATSGFVGLRVTATDTTTGASITQTHHRAYILE